MLDQTMSMVLRRLIGWHGWTWMEWAGALPSTIGPIHGSRWGCIVGHSHRIKGQVGENRAQRLWSLYGVPLFFQRRVAKEGWPVLIETWSKDVPSAPTPLSPRVKLLTDDNNRLPHPYLEVRGEKVWGLEGAFFYMCVSGQVAIYVHMNFLSLPLCYSKYIRTHSISLHRSRL